MAERLEVGVAPQVVEVAIAEFEGALERGQRRLGHAEDSVAAREVVPREGGRVGA